MALLHINKVKRNRKAFAEKIIQISQKLGIDPDWLMQIMYFETARTMDSSIQNSSTNATGLIQFMPSTAKYLGTSVNALRRMSNVKQLDYVYKYLKDYAHKYTSYVDLYFAVFFPLAIGKPSNWIFETKELSRSLIAKRNKIFDLNKDGQLTVSEVEKVMLRDVPETYIKRFKKKESSSPVSQDLLLQLESQLQSMSDTIQVLKSQNS